MSSQNLKKYLAYYQKTIREEPENIEARLRLASLFKEIGQRSHAIEEYVTASKLLASQGLPLEAIAACKAVLELDPDHTEIKFFLARLFAQAPEVSGAAARVARPVEESGGPMRRREMEAPRAPEHNARVVLEVLSTDEMDAFEASGEAPIMLAQPKDEPESIASAIDSALSNQPPSDSLIEDNPLYAEPIEDDEDEPLDELELGPPTGEYTRTYDARDKDALQAALDVMTPPRPPRPVAPSPADSGLRSTVVMEPGEQVALDEELRSTVAMSEEEAHRHRTLALAARASTGTAKWPAHDRSVDRRFSDEITKDTVVAPEVELDPDVPDLPDIALFSSLNQRAFVELLERVTLHEVGAGEAIIDRGREEPRLFIIVSGQARAYKDVDGVEVELGEFVEGEFFGEFALLTGRTNHATVRATTDVVALGVSEQDLHEVAAHDPEVWDTLWDYYHVRMLNNLMVSDTIFGKLSRETRDELIDLFELQELVQGDVLVDAAQPCPCVCLVLFGQLSITPSAPGGEVRAVREGEFFGFVASLSDEACGATVAATSDATLLCLPARAFRGVTRSNAGVAGEIRRLLRTRHQRPDLFLTGITRYAEHGVVD